jgi:hypothetical protein
MVACVTSGDRVEAHRPEKKGLRLPAGLASGTVFPAPGVVGVELEWSRCGMATQPRGRREPSLNELININADNIIIPR